MDLQSSETIEVVGDGTRINMRSVEADSINIPDNLGNEAGDGPCPLQARAPATTEYFTTPQCGLTICGNVPKFDCTSTPMPRCKGPNYQSFKFWYILQNLKNEEITPNKQSTSIYLIKVDFSDMNHNVNRVLDPENRPGGIKNVEDSSNYGKIFSQKFIKCSKVVDIQNSLKNEKLVILFVYDPKINEIFTIYLKNGYSRDIIKTQISIVNCLRNSVNSVNSGQKSTFVASINLVLHNIVFQIFPDILKNFEILLPKKKSAATGGGGRPKLPPAPDRAGPLKDFVIEGKPLNSIKSKYIITNRHTPLFHHLYLFIFPPLRLDSIGRRAIPLYSNTQDLSSSEQLSAMGLEISDEPLCIVPTGGGLATKTMKCPIHIYYLTPFTENNDSTRIINSGDEDDLLNLEFYASLQQDGMVCTKTNKNYPKGLGQYWGMDEPVPPIYIPPSNDIFK